MAISYGAVPITVIHDRELSSGCVKLYCEIARLSGKKRFCWASNQYFTKVFKEKERTVCNWLKKLEDQKHIKIVEENTKNGSVFRKINVVAKIFDAQEDTDVDDFTEKQMLYDCRNLPNSAEIYQEKQKSANDGRNLPNASAEICAYNNNNIIPADVAITSYNIKDISNMPSANASIDKSQLDISKEVSSLNSSSENLSKADVGTILEKRRNRASIGDKPKKTIPYFAADSDEYLLSELLLEYILKLNPRYKLSEINTTAKKQRLLRKWALNIWKLLTEDERSFAEVKAVIDFCGNNSFWRANILSTASLRAKFSILQTKMLSEKNNTKQEYNKQKSQLDPSSYEYHKALEAEQKAFGVIICES